MQKILIDSGPLIALFDRKDKFHLAAVEFIKNNRSELVTTLASVTETLHLLDFNRHEAKRKKTVYNTDQIKRLLVVVAHLV